MLNIKRDTKNPILKPVSNESWQATAVFNSSPTVFKKEKYLYYRAVSAKDNLTGLYTSSIGISKQGTGGDFENGAQALVGSEPFDIAGVEDPRVTTIGTSTYIFYTALSANPPSPENITVAVAVTKDNVNFVKHHVTPFNAKAMTLFPEKINGKYAVIFTLHPDIKPAKIAIAYADKIEDFWDNAFWMRWYDNREKYFLPELRRSDKDHVEVGSAPLYTKDGWLLIYSHIQNYFSEHDKVFGIEALLLDHDNPLLVKGRTSGPLLLPEEVYERYGMLPNITFPSGADIERDTLSIYYGGADTVCCRAYLSLSKLLNYMQDSNKESFVRFDGNPVLTPIKEHAWENYAVFNPSALIIDKKTYIIYRAMSLENTSSFGLAISEDGLSITERLAEPIYVPRLPFEQKLKPPTGYSGCEDPRSVIIDGRIYVTYTAYNGIDAPSVAVTSISVEDFKNRLWDKWELPILLTPAGLDDKDACFFPEKVDGKYVIFHRVSSHICADVFDSLDFVKEKVTKCINILGPRVGMWDSEKVGIASAPHKMKNGDWLLFYHGVSKNSTYKLGAVILDENDISKVKARSLFPLFEPKTDYELFGQVGSVVFPCGSTIQNKKVYIYYGGGDSVVGVATAELSDILKGLE